MMTQSNDAGRSAASASIVTARNSAFGFLPTDSLAHSILRTSRIDPDDAALGMAVQQQRRQHAVAAADVEDVVARGLRGDGLERRER